MADGHGDRDGPEGVWRGREGVHPSQVAAQDQVLLAEGQVYSVLVRLQKGAGGVQGGDRGARDPAARGRHDRLCRGRGGGAEIAKPLLRVEAHRGVRVDKGDLLKGIRQDIRCDVRWRAADKISGHDQLGDIPEISGGDPREQPLFYMVLDNTSYHKPKSAREYVDSTGGGVELEFLPPYTPQLNPVETVWRDLKRRLAGRFFRSLEELKAAITAILEREMGNRLKGYLVA